MSHGTSNDISQGLGNTGRVATKGTARASSRMFNSLKNSAKKTVNLIKKSAKKSAEMGAKATAKTLGTVLKSLFATPVGWIILAVLLLLLIILCVGAHDPSTVHNYNHAVLYYTYKPSSTDKETSETTEVEYGSEVVKTKNSDFLNDDLVEYDGESHIGQPCLQYKEYFDEVFRKVFDEYCRLEVETVIKERNLDYEKTIESYEENKDAFLDLNYAELYTVMSQNPDFSLYNGSLEAIQEWLADENHFKYLYYMVLNERMESTVFWEKEIIYSEDDYPYESTVIGTMVEEEKINVPRILTGSKPLVSWLGKAFSSASKKELKEYAEEVKNEEFEEIQGLYTNGRTVVVPNNNDKPCWTFTSTLLSKETVEEETDTILEDGTKETKEVTYYTVKEKLTSTYNYGECLLKPYCLNDLYQCFNITPNDQSVDHPLVDNITLLDDQETYLRNYIGSDEYLLGKRERSDVNSAYEILINSIISDEMLSQYGVDFTNSDAFVQSLWAVAKSYEGVTYNSNFAGFSHFVCCNYVWTVFNQLGIDICPKKLPQEAINTLGSKANCDIRNHCTLMVYYYKHYQPQAIVSTEYSEGILKAGDFVYTQVSLSGYYPYSNLPHSEYSDHVYIYLGDGYMAENCGGSYNRVVIRKVQKNYKPATFIVVRPSLLR